MAALVSKAPNACAVAFMSAMVLSYPPLTLASAFAASLPEMMIR